MHDTPEDVSSPFTPVHVREVLGRVLELRTRALGREQELSQAITAAAPAWRGSAANLVHYMAMRDCELRPVQRQLSELGLSSLGRAEAHVLASLDTLAFVLARLAGAELPAELQRPPRGALPSKDELREHTHALLGVAAGQRVMVTMPSEAAQDYALVAELLNAGMTCMRVNCAHDEPDAWEHMVMHLRRAEAELGKSCRVLFDLPGPKLRVSPFEDGGMLRVSPGDELTLTSQGTHSRREVRADDGKLLERGSVHCGAADAVAALRPGQAVFFDDGKVSATTVHVDAHGALVRIVRAKPLGSKLRAQAGVNLPETDFRLPALSAEDCRALDVAVRQADIVGLSFVQRRSDVRALHEELERRGGTRLGVLLKIETRQGFAHLPAILLEAMRRPPLDVMIARGDLAVECGFDRLAELQEEILWVCEAAHVPVVWATQVLDRLAKKGVASRAEITDAAMAGRAECVMLNKGPYVLEAIRTVLDVGQRMRGHQNKKTSMLRPLQSLTLHSD